MTRILSRRMENEHRTDKPHLLRTVPTLVATPTMIRPFASTAITRLPTTVPIIDPMPPVRGVPPITTAEIAMSSNPIPTVRASRAELRGDYTATVETGECSRYHEYLKLNPLS